MLRLSYRFLKQRASLFFNRSFQPQLGYDGQDKDLISVHSIIFKPDINLDLDLDSEEDDDEEEEDHYYENVTKYKKENDDDFKICSEPQIYEHEYGIFSELGIYDFDYDNYPQAEIYGYKLDIPQPPTIYRYKHEHVDTRNEEKTVENYKHTEVFCDTEEDCVADISSIEVEFTLYDDELETQGTASDSTSPIVVLSIRSQGKPVEDIFSEESSSGDHSRTENIRSLDEEEEEDDEQGIVTVDGTLRLLQQHPDVILETEYMTDDELILQEPPRVSQEQNQLRFQREGIFQLDNQGGIKLHHGQENDPTIGISVNSEPGETNDLQNYTRSELQYLASLFKRYKSGWKAKSKTLQQLEDNEVNRLYNAAATIKRGAFIRIDFRQKRLAIFL